MSLRLLYLWRTLRHLRGRQMAAQVMHRFRPVLESPARFGARHAPPFPGRSGRSIFPSVWSGRPQPAAAECRRGRFAFLDRSEALGWPPEWARADLPRLWQYHLHYFDWLLGLGYADAREAVRDWIRAHPLGRGRVGWEPYPISVRLPNWCAFFFGRFAEETERDAPFLAELWPSLYRQAEWLARHLEFRLMGNHLFENGAALCLAGDCFRGGAAERWRRIGRGILEREFPEQVLADGMHFERSPMYHQRMSALALALAAVEDPTVRALAAARLPRMVAALGAVCHPDGGIALFNDSALGAAMDARAFLDLARHQVPAARSLPPPPPGAWALREAGYYGFRSADGSFAICDAGDVGPDYIPGHAHGDIFSFELSLQEQRVIVDAGVYDYERGAMRDYCRSTAAHNTVEIGGQDQCEFWDVFRVARRGRPRDVVWQPSPHGFRLTGWHDGYARLRGSPRHRREFVWEAPSTLRVRDSVHSARPVRAVSRLHLHPACWPQLAGDREAVVDHPAGRFRIALTGAGVMRLEDSLYCPEFGVQVANRCVTVALEGKEIQTGFVITPADE